MSGGSGPQTHSGSDVPPGFGALPKPSSNPVPSNVRRTSTTSVGGSSSSSVALEFRAKPPKKRVSRDGVCMEDRHEGESSVNGSKRVTRTRARPQFFDPSPHPTRKRGRGRPPGSGRRPRLVSWLSQRELEIGGDSQANIYIPPSIRSDGNLSSPPVHTQLFRQGICTTTLPLICQNSERGSNTKKEPQVVAVGGQETAVRTHTACAEHVHEAPIASLLRENPVIADAPANTSDDTRESQPIVDGITVQVGSYDVNPSLAPTLKAIMNKHGDIAQDCPLESIYMRNAVLEGICKVVQELQRTKLSKLNKSMLYKYDCAVKDARKMKLNVRWLHQQLDKIRDALKSYEHAKTLIEKTTNRMEKIEIMKKNVQVDKVQLEKLKSSIEKQEGTLVLETQQNEKLIVTIRELTSRFQHFLNDDLMDGLL